MIPCVSSFSPDKHAPRKEHLIGPLLSPANVRGIEITCDIEEGGIRSVCEVFPKSSTICVSGFTLYLGSSSIHESKKNKKNKRNAAARNTDWHSGQISLDVASDCLAATATLRSRHPCPLQGYSKSSHVPVSPHGIQPWQQYSRCSYISS